jgi:hypothetical protein
VRGLARGEASFLGGGEKMSSGGGSWKRPSSAKQIHLATFSHSHSALVLADPDGDGGGDAIWYEAVGAVELLLFLRFMT